MATYTDRTRVLHVNDVAGVPSALVRAANAHGRSWRLRSLPPVRPPMWRAALERAADLTRWMGERGLAEVLHVHYGPNGYLSWGSARPHVLHLHGTDVRVDLHRSGAGWLTRRSILEADAVVYATEDLADAVRELRPDATWVPNPLPPGILDRSTPAPVPGRVVFCSRWEESKGGAAMVEAATTMVDVGVQVHGLDWGDLADRAKACGVVLYPRMSQEDYWDFLAQAHLVVGQHSFGVPGTSELQAMALGRPVVMDAPGVPVIASTRTDLVDVVREALADPDRLEQVGGTGRSWVLDHHAPVVSVHALEQIYRRITS
ncbi:glycosyltransferase family 4 protein [Schaalia sp. 19OD2882]|uniref:glycosyltransferase family 4 protein n=1 Tax=Schaalia sp. 19OD2882 TaxID=2794089 RepID=UPI001C1EB218|nr:glycosyltransferase family 4 protein [Schaalia sp. 19OD2882]QWW20277.1 glycosyltransferase family 4 protein [Schaalia sp. 19OD2882]